MIPKIIHYCWFGGNSFPELAKKCIGSWKKYFPDYEVKEWNESNYDVHKMPYINEAYKAKKYAFVSDYARFDILYKHGGIYFDTDVEAIKPFDDILENGGFMGLESVGSVAAGLGMGCNAGLDIIRQILNFYANIHFIKDDGSYNLHTVVEYVTAILKNHGLKMENTIQKLNGLTIYPVEYFCPMNFRGQLKITKNSHSIHHFHASWFSETDKIYLAKSRKIYSIIKISFIAKIVVCSMYFYKKIKDIGFINTMFYICKYVIQRIQKIWIR